MNKAAAFIHDSELPDELCDNPECEDHHPRCAWGDPWCDKRGVNWIAGRRWCVPHTAELDRQIAALSLLAALDAPAQPATPACWPVRSEMPLTDAAIAEQRWQARHAQPVHRPAELSGYSKDLRVESAQPVHPEPLDYRRGLQAAYRAVRSLNGDGFYEPSDPALDAAQSAIQRLLREASEPEGDR